MRQSKWLAVIPMVFLLLSVLSCGQQDVVQVQTVVSDLSTSAVRLETQAAPRLTELAKLTKTDAPVRLTQLANLAETAQAAATRLANVPPSPWDTNWLPPDHAVVVDRIDAIVEGSGLAGKGAVLLSDALEMGVNPAFALAMFRKEAEFAKPGTRANKNNNPGNIIATGKCRGMTAGSICKGAYGEVSTDGRFGVYASMEDGIKAYFLLLQREYQPGTARNCSDIACIIPAYCPPSDCDTDRYIQQITGWVRDYQRQLSGA